MLVLDLVEYLSQKLQQDFLNEEHEDLHLEDKIEELVKEKNIRPVNSRVGVIVKGIDNCLVKLSKCCNPLPGDEIIGYITKGRGVSIHRTDCANVKELMQEDEGRMIEVYWVDEVNGSYKVEIEIMANDRNGLLRDIIKQVENMKIHLVGVNTKTTRENIAIIDVSLELQNKEILNKIISAFRKVESVYDVSRRRN